MPAPEVLTACALVAELAYNPTGSRWCLKLTGCLWALVLPLSTGV